MIKNLGERKFYNGLKISREMSNYFTKKNNIDISGFILENLEKYKFDKKEKGTEYLETTIRCLYDERYGFVDYSDYFDFNNPSNPMYVELRCMYEVGLPTVNRDIKKSIEKSDLAGLSENEVVYKIVNEAIKQFEPTAKELKLNR